MAQKIVTQLVDDLDGTELDQDAGETVVFALDGTTYELDLSLKNADTFRGVFQDYIAAGRKVTGTRGPRKGGNKASTGSDAKVIRDWANANKIDVPDRGRVPADVREKYEAAQ